MIYNSACPISIRLFKLSADDELKKDMIAKIDNKVFIYDLFILIIFTKK